MNEQDRSTPTADRPPHHRFGIWLLLSVGAVVALLGLAGLALTGRMVAMPGWVTAQVEARLNAQMAPAGLRLGGMDVRFSHDEIPRVHFTDIVVLDGAGREVAQLPDLNATLAAGPILAGRLAVTRVALSGAELTVRRAPDGRLDLALGGAGAPVSAGGNLGAVLDEIDRAFSAPGLAAVEAISVEGLGLTYEDARAGRTWRVGNGLMTLEQTDRDIALRAFFSLTGQSETPAEFAFSVTSVKGGPEARFSANFSDVPSADIATQSPALAALALIDAPISGAIRTEVNPAGELGPLSATLEIGAGDLRPAGGAPPIHFASGKSYFTYDPAARRLSFDQIALDTAVLRLTADGHADLRGMEQGWPTAMIGQLAFREVALDPEGVFEEPAVFTGGALDLKLELDPLTATIGQVVLLDEGRSYRGDGTVRALPEGWEVALDVAIDRITGGRLLTLWPLRLAPNTRKWFSENVLEGDLEEVRAALRLPATGEPRVSLSHSFREAEVSFLKTMPPITGGSGYSTINGKTYTLSVESGTIAAPGGGQVDVAGSVLQVPDVTAKPAHAEIALRTDSTIAAALALIDLPPLEIPARAGLDHDLAEGRAEIETRLSLPLVKGLTLSEVSYAVSGTLREVRSDTLVPGRILEAGALSLTAGAEEVAIGGAATLDGVPVRGTWRRTPGPEAGGASRVEGTVELSARAADAFGIGLPQNSLSGTGRGDFALALAPGAAPRLTLTSDLAGLGLGIDALGWSKPPSQTGRLEVDLRLGDDPAVERLALEAAGLSATGSVALAEGGGLEAARFAPVRLGGWLDATVVLTGRGAGNAPAVAVTGGTIDLRRTSLAGGGGGSGGPGRGGGGGSVQIALDRLIVSDGIALAGVRGRVSAQGGLNGQLTGQLEGGGPLAVTLAPARNGTAIRVRAEDAGAALRGAGLYRQARGGNLDLVLQPEPGPGRYDGQLRIDDLHVRGTPALAELLSAISVVGLLELMEGEGIQFTDVEGRFRIQPGAVELSRGSAIGPSLGISMAGVYGTATRRLDMQGVISPVYLLNSIGSVLTRRGEGLFGFNYRLTGPASAPSVQVNPLSILTPGMFRELFRGPPPTVQRRPAPQEAE